MLPRGAATPEDKRAMQTPSLASSSCLLPLAKGMAHTPPGARPRGTASHPHPTARYTNRLEVGAGAHTRSHRTQEKVAEGSQARKLPRSQERRRELGVAGAQILTPVRPFREQLLSGGRGKELQG